MPAGRAAGILLMVRERLNLLSGTLPAPVQARDGVRYDTVPARWRIFPRPLEPWPVSRCCLSFSPPISGSQRMRSLPLVHAHGGSLAPGATRRALDETRAILTPRTALPGTTSHGPAAWP